MRYGEAVGREGCGGGTRPEEVRGTMFRSLSAFEVVAERGYAPGGGTDGAGGGSTEARGVESGGGGGGLGCGNSEGGTMDAVVEKAEVDVLGGQEVTLWTILKTLVQLETAVERLEVVEGTSMDRTVVQERFVQKRLWIMETEEAEPVEHDDAGVATELHWREGGW